MSPQDVHFIDPAALACGAQLLSSGQAQACLLATADLDPAQFEAWLTLLDEHERQHAARFHQPRHRQDYIAAHALTRLLLSACCGAPAESLQFHRPPDEKPRLLGADAVLRFSLSHTDGMVACAVAHGQDIGLDVEAMIEADDVLDTAQAACTSAELALIEAAAPDARSSLFLRLWTLKEAFLKATGEGLSRPLDSFSVQFDPLAVILVGDHRPLTGWDFAQIFPSPRHILAVATRCAE